ncbi:hypothetical protein [Priestia endophytica]|uniref:hypothetical protein n=1 Tax=Priestia endophytica TaxID=135735 RepID=UPI00124DD5B7|nr:hypothetical protein [Priestia endophytica]KAB2488211.1 hypothetical protein F8155_25355 [Priestia endophytica]
MNFGYNYFTGTGNAGDLAWAIARLFVREFNPAASVAHIASSLTTKFRAIYNSIGGSSFAWGDLGGAILDIGELLLTFAPSAGIWRITKFLWGSSNLL